MGGPSVIVLGTGGVGSATLLALARRGVPVLGLDRFPPGHDRGSSHGETRIIRMSYFEHPDYVPLLRRAYRLWDDLSEKTGEDLFHRTGLVYFGRSESPVIGGVLASAKGHGLEVEQLSVDGAAARFPGFMAPEDSTVLFEPDAGYLRVEDAIREQIAEACRLGAEHRFGETVLGWSSNGRSVEVETDRGVHHADRLVVTAGCWAADLLRDLGVPFRILRQHLHWFAVDRNDYFETRDCPCFMFETGDGHFYGFPAAGPMGLKVAEHGLGTEIDDPLTDARQPEAGDSERIEAFLKKHLPGVSSNRVRQEVCFYTMTPDEHFIVDRHPEYDNVAIAAGLSGHGFKFAPVLGETLADLAVDGKTDKEIAFLSVGRFG